MKFLLAIDFHSLKTTQAQFFPASPVAWLIMAPISHFLPVATSLAGVSVIALSAAILLYLISRAFLSVPYPKGIPLIGEPEGATRFSFRTYLRYYTDCQGLFRDAYDNVPEAHFLHPFNCTYQESSIPRKESW